MAQRRYKQAPPPATVILTPTATPGIYDEVTSFSGGGTGGTTNVTATNPTVTATRPAVSMTVGSTVSQLAVPAGATEAYLYVISGEISRAINGVPGAGTPWVVTGGQEFLEGTMMADFRMTRRGGVDAVVWVEYNVRS